MLRPNADALSVSHKVLRILIALNWLFGAAILGLLIWTFLAAEWVARALGADDSPRALLGMRLIAWSVLALELSRFVVVGIANSVSTAARPVHIDLNFSVAPWLAVLLLFVLARVFEHGARMREDLDGTV
jgi:hypothetical protein